MNPSASSRRIAGGLALAASLLLVAGCSGGQPAPVDQAEAAPVTTTRTPGGKDIYAEGVNPYSGTAWMADVDYSLHFASLCDELRRTPKDADLIIAAYNEGAAGTDRAEMGGWPTEIESVADCKSSPGKP